MSASRVVSLLLAGAVSAATVSARPHGYSCTPGRLVSVSVEVDGRPASLYRARDGSGRFYLEAREGRRYALTLRNRSAERLGVVLTVDGLNVISGERDRGRGRMYVLDPWQRTRVRGWRTSLREVRQFTFVDEGESYAARSGKANRKMGWIEVAVYRERDAARLQATRPHHREWIEPLERTDEVEGDRPEREEARSSARSKEAPAAPSAAGEAARSYPGTGWGRRTHDPAVLVGFRPESQPAQTITLRYEYRPALVALGILPGHFPADRLRQRERAEPGFAQPPLW